MLLLSYMKLTRHRQFTVVPITKDAVTEGKETLIDPKDFASSASG